MPETDRRREFRAPVLHENCQVLVADSDETAELGVIIDINPDGAGVYVRSAEHFSFRERIQVRFEETELAGEVRNIIRCKTGWRLGLRWTDLKTDEWF